MPQRMAQLTFALFLGSLALTAACSRPNEPALPATPVEEALAPPVGPVHDHASHSHFDASTGFIDGEARVSFRQEVAPMLRQHCAGCHTTGGPGAAALTMFDAAGLPQHAAIQGHVGHMILEIQTGRMPAGKPNSLPADQFRLLDVWAASGAPDN